MDTAHRLVLMLLAAALLTTLPATVVVHITALSAIDRAVAAHPAATTVEVSK